MKKIYLKPDIQSIQTVIQPLMDGSTLNHADSKEQWLDDDWKWSDETSDLEETSWEE